MKRSGPTSSQAEATPAQAKNGQSELPLPGDASLVSSAAVAEFQEFPEAVPRKGKSGAEERVEGIRGSDRVYETQGSYKDTIAFYLGQLPAAGFDVDSQTSTNTSTTWSAKRPDGRPVRLIVRNTAPTTVEWITASSTARGAGK
jgi:hypothetical protein